MQQPDIGKSPLPGLFPNSDQTTVLKVGPDKGGVGKGLCARQEKTAFAASEVRFHPVDGMTEERLDIERGGQLRGRKDHRGRDQKKSFASFNAP